MTGGLSGTRFSKGRLEQPVGQVWYFGNQWVLAALMAVTWTCAGRLVFLTRSVGDVERRRFEIMGYAQPVLLALPIAMAIVRPRSAYNSLVVAFLISTVIARRASTRNRAVAA